MNEAHKTVLQRHFKQLVEGIMMSESLYAALFQRKVFEREMLEAIRAEKTPTEQAYKMLSMLPKRGPEAFDTFVDIIKTDYPWLAAMLMTDVKAETELFLSRQNSLVNLCVNCGNGGQKPESQTDGATPRLVLDIQADPDIKTRVGTFIHKQFGQSKRISQQDKKSMEKWLSEQIQTERKFWKKKETISLSDEETQDSSSCTSPEPIDDDLKRIFNKVRDENLSDFLNSEHASKQLDAKTEENGSDQIDSTTDKEIEDIPKVVVKLEEEIDKLINRMNEMEGLLTQCHYILGDPDRKHKLSTLVKDSNYEKKQAERELTKEKEKSEKMLSELYDYCKNINRLEQVRQHQRHDLEKKTEEIEKLQRENVILQEKCKMLEEVNNRHIEKEKTLNNLKKMVDDLRMSHTNLADENANYRINYGTNALSRKRPIRTVSRRGSTMVESTTPGMARKPTTRPVLATTNRRSRPMNRF